jgi:hypothetical protein
MEFLLVRPFCGVVPIRTTKKGGPEGPPRFSFPNEPN